MAESTQVNLNKHRKGRRLRAVIWTVAALALFTPLIAMQFTEEVSWTPSDFVVFGAMLLFVCGAYELGSRFTGDRAYRLALGIALLGAFFLVWANLAVGIVGSEANPINLLFFFVPVIGLLGAVIGRFKPRGMSRAMKAAAITQGLVALIVWAGGWGQVWPVTLVYVLLWLVSAYLFHRSARRPAEG